MICLSKGTGYLDYIPKSIDKAVKGVQISGCKKVNQAQLELSLTKLLSDVMEFHGQNWSGNILLRLVDMIICDFWYMKVEEIAMIINRPYKVFGHLKPNDVIQWLKDYEAAERTPYFEGESSKHKESYEKQLVEMERQDRLNDKRKQNEAIKQESFRETARQIVKGRKDRNDL